MLQNSAESIWKAWDLVFLIVDIQNITFNSVTVDGDCQEVQVHVSELQCCVSITSQRNIESLWSYLLEGGMVYKACLAVI